MLSQFQIDDTNRMVDMVGVARANGSELSRFGTDYRGTCPIHKGDDATSFSIYKAKDGSYRWRCFSTCDAGGDGIQLYMILHNVTFKEAVEMIRGGRVFEAATAKIMAEKHEKQRVLDEQADLEKYKAHLAHYTYHSEWTAWRDNPEPWVTEEWERRGLVHPMRTYFGFGGCTNHKIGDKYYRTLTIPIWDYGYNLINIRHRVLSNDVAGRYRPDVAGIPAAPFMSHPYLGYSEGVMTIVVEGEIKAAVLSQLLLDPEIQVVGVPGKSMFAKVQHQFTGKNYVVIPDPDAAKETTEFARAIKAKYVRLPAKVDDYIIQNNITKDAMVNIIKGGRLV